VSGAAGPTRPSLAAAIQAMNARAHAHLPRRRSVRSNRWNGRTRRLACRLLRAARLPLLTAHADAASSRGRRRRLRLRPRPRQSWPPTPLQLSSRAGRLVRRPRPPPGPPWRHPRPPPLPAAGQEAAASACRLRAAAVPPAPARTHPPDPVEASHQCAHSTAAAKPSRAPLFHPSRTQGALRVFGELPPRQFFFVFRRFLLCSGESFFLHQITYSRALGLASTSICFFCNLILLVLGLTIVW